MNTGEIVPAAVQEAPSSSSATYTSKQLKEFLERNWNTIRDQSRYLVENTETAVRCAYCKEVVELGEDPSQREVNWAVHVKLDHKRRPFIDDPHCELIFGTDTRVSCSACETDIALTRSWLHQKWEKHITTVSHRRNVGEITTPTPSDARRQRFADDPAVIVLSDFDIHCLVCKRDLKLADTLAWASWERHLKSKAHQARASASSGASPLSMIGWSANTFNS
ncbi:hypothetical protein DFP72DRAFT_839467 [Ephemerocybe angulata]|uniref:Uncharacterized protein n=1 Tax=Ephemerocybe angulata TaxID=980116 RepID=A0A8H6IHB9_9AGAR|nr:hypothetical protein DFP72DRAFT_839467 [Tulosesus angulatus]